MTTPAYSIDRDKFLDIVCCDLFKKKMTDQQTETLKKMLDYWEEHLIDKPLSYLAYTLATAYHETDRTFGPIREYGGPGLRYAPYYGRGLVQLTWKNNYERMGKLFDPPLDLVKNPDLALDVDIAIPIIFKGMKDGLFTGKSYDHYLSGRTPNYVGARRIINGTDKAEVIANYAKKFEKAIKQAQVPYVPKAPTPVIEETKPASEMSIKELTKVSKGFWIANRAKNFARWVAAGMAGTGLFEYLGYIQNFLTSWQGMLSIGIAAVLLWVAIEYIYRRKKIDIKEGRVIPSGVAKDELPS